MRVNSEWSASNSRNPVGTRRPTPLPAARNGHRVARSTTLTLANDEILETLNSLLNRLAQQFDPAPGTLGSLSLTGCPDGAVFVTGVPPGSLVGSANSLLLREKG